MYSTTHAHLVHMSSSSEEEEEEEEGNDVEVVWAKSVCGVWGLGHVFDGKLYFTRDICEESGSLRIWCLRRSRWLPPRQEQRLPPSQEESQPPNGLVWLCKRALLPPTINRFALHLHQLGTQSIDHPTDNVHFQAVCVLSVLRSDTHNLKNIRQKSS